MKKAQKSPQKRQQGGGLNLKGENKASQQSQGLKRGTKEQEKMMKGVFEKSKKGERKGSENAVQRK